MAEKEKKEGLDTGVHLSHILYPYYCSAIGCPLQRKDKCSICRLGDILSGISQEEAIKKIAEKGDEGDEGPGVDYDPDAVPCPLEELGTFTYREWLAMSKVHFKKNADRAINLVAQMYRTGEYKDPKINVTHVDDDGHVTYYLVFDKQPNVDYGDIAVSIYSKMRILIAKAQIIQDSCSRDGKTSVTETISYMADAKIVFLKHIELFCRHRVTKERLDALVKEKAAEWIEKKRVEKEKQEAARKEREELENTLRRMCREANERYGTMFTFDEKSKKIYALCPDEEAERRFEEKGRDVLSRLEKISQEDWIIMKTYASSQGVYQMCGAYSSFRSTYKELWENRGQERKKKGRIVSAAFLIAYIPELYEDFVDVTDNYAKRLLEEEERREKIFEAPKKIVDRERLPRMEMRT